MPPDTKKSSNSQNNGKLNSPVACREKLTLSSKSTQVQADYQADPAREIGGPAGPEPTRYGDWQVNGRCSDF